MHPAMLQYRRIRNGRGGWDMPNGPGMVRISPPTCGTAEGFSCYPGGLGGQGLGVLPTSPLWIVAGGAAVGAIGAWALMMLEIGKLRRHRRKG